MEYPGWELVGEAYRKRIAFSFEGVEHEGWVEVPASELEASDDPQALLNERTDEGITQMHDAAAEAVGA